MNYVVQFLIVAGLVVLSCVKVTLQGRMSRQYVHNTQDVLWFNVLLFVAMSAGFAAFFQPGEVNGVIAGFAAADAIGTMTFQACYALAMTSGPVSLTVLIANLGVFIGTIGSILFFGEQPYMTHVAGMVFLCASMLLSVKPEQSGKKVNVKWLMLSLVAMLASASSSLVRKFFALQEAAKLPGADSTYLVLTYGFAAVLALVIYLLMTRFGGKEKTTIGFKRNPLVYAVVITLVLCVYNKGYMLAIANIPGTFFFPVSAGMQSLLMGLIGVVLFHDKLSRRQWVGVLCGVASVALMNLRFGLL